MKRIPVIIGPTSSGKTSLSLELCRKFSGNIISADSRQIFKKMNIGTGKVPVDSDVEAKNFVTYWTLNDVSVFGYDLAFPNEYFSAEDYSNWALKKVTELSNENTKNIFIVGGTGFYIDLITNRAQTSKVLPNFELRDSLKKLSLPDLQNRLNELAPDVFESIDKNNPARLIRSIEIAESNLNSNKDNEDIPAELLGLEKTENFVLPKDEYEFFFIGLEGSRELLFSRADNWVEKIWLNGIIEEARDLIKLGYRDTLAMRGIVYKTITEYIDGNFSEDDAKQRIKYDIHAYIRRQQTWFKRNKDITWFNIEEPSFFQKVANHVQSKIDG